MKIDDRYHWALQKLELSAGDKVLEVGFGAGILLDLMAGDPSEVSITGVDKTTSTSNRARIDRILRNASGRVEIIHDNLLNAPLPKRTYSKIVAFNVPFFRKESSPELAVLRELLTKKGRLYVFYQNPGAAGDHDLRRIVRNLEGNNFTITASGFRPENKRRSLYVIAQP